MAGLNTKLDKIKYEKKAKILGIAEEGHQQIAGIDNIRFLALNSIKSILNMQTIITLFLHLLYTL
jgi:hypothetical protein